jgi:predicted N-acetyltransferase YhbS
MHYPCDLMVAPAARGQGLAQRLWGEYLDSTDSLSCVPLYAPATGKLCAKLGYAPVAAVPACVRVYDVTAALRHLISSRLPASTASTALQWLAAAAGVVLNAGIAVANAVRHPRRIGAYDVERAREAPQELDALWDNLSAEFSVLAVRDRAFVQWRFFDDPEFDHLFFVARDGIGNLVGYVDAVAVHRRNLRIGRIMDLLCSPARTDVADTLIAAALTELERQHVALVTCVGLHPSIRDRVRRCLYVRRRPSAPAMLLWKGVADLEPIVHCANAWHLTLADGDEGFSP